MYKPIWRRSTENAKSALHEVHPVQVVRDEKQRNAAPKSDIAPNAEVWKKYVEETDRFDKELVDGWNNSLDMLLIFAALFSAISTAFVLESTRDLKPDYAETSAQALSNIILFLSSENAANSSNVPGANQSAFSPSPTAVMVNILWFMSLSLSVAVALIAIVAKDWCYQFMSGRSGAFLSQGRRRQLRWEGIEKWGMQEILNVLPLMMHAALLLFAAGLVLYLWDINPRVALPVLVTTVTVGLFYLITLCLPLFFRYCPFTTGLAKLFLPYWYTIATPILESILRALGIALLLPMATISLISSLFRQVITYSRQRESENPETRLRHWITQVSFNTCWKTSKEAIKEHIKTLMRGFVDDRSKLVGQEAPMDDVTSSMLGWMITHCEDSNSANTAYRALVCAKPWLPRAPLVKSGALESTVTRITAYQITWDDTHYADDKNSHVALTQTVLLLSRSLSFMTQTVNLELPDGYLGAIHRVWRVLDHSWDSRDELGYGLVAKELGSLSLHLSDQWKRHLDYREQLSRQTALLEGILTGIIPGLSPMEICYLIDGITKSYLHHPDQSPNSLVRLLNIQAYENHLQLCQTVSVALTIAYVANYERSECNPVPGQNNRLKQAKKLYVELTTMPLLYSLDHEQEYKQLLLFGLVGFLLASPNAKWDIDIQLLADKISKIDQRLDITIDHPALGMTQEPVKMMAQWLLPFGQATVRGPIPTNTPHEGADAIIDVPSGSPLHPKWMAGGHDTSAASGLRDEAACLEPAKHILRLLRGAVIPTEIHLRPHANFGEPVIQYDARSALKKLIEINVHEEIYKIISSQNGDLIPHCMSFLWVFTRSILVITRNPHRSVDLDARSILNPLRLPQYSLPANMADMGFTESWINKLKDACARNPQNVLESRILDKMIKYYKSDDEYYDTCDTDDAFDTGENEEFNEAENEKTSLSDRPGSETRTTWLDILEALARTCREETSTSGSEPRQDHEVNIHPVEESWIEETGEEDLTRIECAKWLGEKPVGGVEGDMKSSQLPPEVLEYVPSCEKIIRTPSWVTETGWNLPDDWCYDGHALG